MFCTAVSFPAISIYPAVSCVANYVSFHTNSSQLVTFLPTLQNSCLARNLVTYSSKHARVILCWGSLGWTIKESWFDSWQGQGIFSSPWYPTQPSYPVGRGDYCGGGLKLTTHPHLAPRLRMHGAVPPLMRRCLIMHRDNFTFILYNTIMILDRPSVSS
jgi:hypothetical protein